MRQKLNFFKKTSQNFRIVPSSPGSPSAVDPYYSLALHGKRPPESYEQYDAQQGADTNSAMHGKVQT